MEIPVQTAAVRQEVRQEGQRVGLVGLVVCGRQAGKLEVFPVAVVVAIALWEVLPEMAPTARL